MKVEVSKKNITAQLSLKINKTCDAEPKKREKIMIKKNISLYALMMLLGAGLYGSDKEQMRLNNLINSDKETANNWAKKIQVNYQYIIDSPKGAQILANLIGRDNKTIRTSLDSLAQNLQDANNWDDSDVDKNFEIKHKEGLMTNLEIVQKALSDGAVKLENAKVAARTAGELDKGKVI